MHFAMVLQLWKYVHEQRLLNLVCHFLLEIINGLQLLLLKSVVSNQGHLVEKLTSVRS